MRWFHEGIDRLHVAITSRIAPPAFRHGIESPSLHEHLAAVHLELPSLSTARRYTLTARTLAGELAAGFQVRVWEPIPSCRYWCIITALGKCPTTKVFGGFSSSDANPGASGSGARPFHRTWLDLIPGLATLHTFLALCAVSVRLIACAAFSSHVGRGAAWWRNESWRVSESDPSPDVWQCGSVCPVARRTGYCPRYAIEPFSTFLAPRALAHCPYPGLAGLPAGLWSEP